MHYPSLVAQMVKNLPAMQETQVQSLGWEDLLEKEMATRSSILAWKIPWTEKPGGLPSMGSQKVKHNWATNTVCVTQQGLKEFRGREWKCSASNGNEEASEGQRKTRSKGKEQCVWGRTEALRDGRRDEDRGRCQREVSKICAPPPPPQVGDQFSLQRTFDFYDTVTQRHSEARYWLVEKNLACFHAVFLNDILIFMRLQR